MRKVFETRAQIRTEAIAKARAEALKEGRAEERREVRANMRKAGISQEVIEQVLEATGAPQPPANGGIDPRLERNIKRLIHEALDERDNR